MAEPNHSMLPRFYIDVKGCPRCKGNHPTLELKKLVNDSPEFTHWGTCPTTLEPIFRKEAVSTNLDDY